MSYDHEGNRHGFDVGQSADTAGSLFEEYLLRRAALDRAESERRVAEAVSVALASGVSWTSIGHLLGLSAQVAEERYGGVVPRAS